MRDVDRSLASSAGTTSTGIGHLGGHDELFARIFARISARIFARIHCHDDGWIRQEDDKMQDDRMQNDKLPGGDEDGLG